MSNTRNGRVAAAVLLSCAVLMLVALLGHGWQRLGIGHANFGPTGVESCTDLLGTSCTKAWWSAIPIEGPIPILAVITLIAGAAAVGFALASGGLVFARRLANVPHRTGRLVLVLAAVIGGTWQVLLSTRSEIAALDSLEMTGVGYGGVLFVVAVVGAFIAMQRLAKHARTPVLTRAPMHVMPVPQPMLPPPPRPAPQPQSYY